MFRSLNSPKVFSVFACGLGAASALGSGPADQCGVVDVSRSGVVRAQSLDLVENQGGGLCDECVIEVHVLVDVFLSDELGEGASQFVDDVITQMNQTWSQPFVDGGIGVGVVLGELTVFEGGNPWINSTDPFVMIQSINSYVNANIPINPVGRDAVIVFSGLDFDLAVVGVGFVETLCRPSAIGLVQAGLFQSEYVASIASHQLGHISGAGHDGAAGTETCGVSGFVMGLPNQSSPADRLSSCSISAIVGYMLDPSFDTLSCLTPPALPCLADLTGEGVLDFFDVSAFLQAFGSQDPIADFTGEGVFDFFDISAFLQAFAAGCP